MSTREIFSRIHRRYDLLNRVLSLGREQAWRRSGAVHLPPGRVLDLGAGTGAAAPVFGEREVVALDPSLEMLSGNPAASRVAGVGERLPFRDGSFEGILSAYVFRNLDSVEAVLAEADRVLQGGGVLVVVDLGRPRNRIARAIHRLGTAAVVPLAGAMVGARSEYLWLHRSLDLLPPPEDLFSEGPLVLERTWRMGPLGFVYGAVLRKPATPT